MDTPSSSAALIAAFEARNANLPLGMRVAFTARDYMIIEILVNPDIGEVQRLIVIFDQDRDLRILQVLTAFFLRDRELCLNLVGLAEEKGEVNYWWSDPASKPYSRRPLQEACVAALWPYDRWTTFEPTVVPMVDGVVDVDNLAARDLLRCAPQRFPLGRVTVKS